jgi:hypothetical protein
MSTSYASRAGWIMFAADINVRIAPSRGGVT